MNRKVLVYLLTLFVSVLLQSTLLEYVAVYGVIPDVILIIILFISLKEGSKWGEIFGFFTGMLIDFLSLSPLGFFALIYCTIGFIMGLTNRNVSTDSLLTQIVFLIMALLIKFALSIFLIMLFSIETTSLSFISRNLPLEIAYSTIIVPFFFAITNRITQLGRSKRTGF